ncbi:MAG TPA: CoA ester lyase [Steroidobacteraceae bacterium]|nr:CoA ester lyase [Steroidobacteraceae bacterium]
MPRSYLFVPGDRPDRFDKAWASPADEVIIDLEDAVAEDKKSFARASAKHWMSPERRVLVRINAGGTQWYRDDLELLEHPGLRGLMMPKAEKLDESLIQSCQALGKCVIPLVETAIGFQHAATLAAAPCVERLAFGTLDFQLDTGILGDDDALLFFRSQMVLVSRLANIQPPLDGVTVEVDDDEVLRKDTLRSKRFGFGGKLCIHPRQVATVNRIFSPTEVEIAWARAVTNAAARSGGAAVAVEGKMVDQPVIRKAEGILRTVAMDSEKRRT